MKLTYFFLLNNNNNYNNNNNNGNFHSKQFLNTRQAKT